MHALVIFVVFVLVVAGLVFSIKKDRKALAKIKSLLKDDVSTEGLNKLELASSAKSIGKKIIIKIVAVLIMILLFYVLI